MRSRNWSRTLTERSGGNGAVAVFMACYDCFFVQSMPRASKQQARYAVGRCLMLWSSNDVTQQGSRPKTKLACSNPVRHSSCFCKPPPPVQALVRWGAVAVAGFAWGGSLCFRCFRALALMHRAPVALFFVAQCLTLRSSGPAFCGPLTLSVRCFAVRTNFGQQQDCFFS